MAKRTTKTAEKVGGGGGDRIAIPGWYHLHVTSLADVYPNGKPIEGLFFEAAAFPGQPEEGKVHGAPLYDPKPGKEETPGGLMAVRKLTAFLVATGLINESQMGQEVEYDTDDAVNRQIVVNLVPDTSDENKGKGFLQVNYDQTLHIDDPRVADLVKEGKVKLNLDAIKLLPAAIRRKPESFDLEKLGGKISSASSNGSAASGSSKPAGNAATSGVNLDDV